MKGCAIFPFVKCTNSIKITGIYITVYIVHTYTLLEEMENALIHEIHIVN